MILSKRLAAITKYINNYECLLDIGTDHAYLPISLLINNKIKSAIVTDINEGPLKNALKSIQKFNLTKQITPILADGLIESNADILVISGMGAENIKLILDAKKELLMQFKRIILQPNKDAYLLREYMQNLGYKIVNEEIVYDYHFYEIIIFEKGKEVLSLNEILYGPINLVNKTVSFKQKYQRRLNLLLSANLKTNNQEIKDEIKILEGILSD